MGQVVVESAQAFAQSNFDIEAVIEAVGLVNGFTQCLAITARIAEG